MSDDVKTTHLFTCDGFMPVDAVNHVEAAKAFGEIAAKRQYGKAGRCHSLSENGVSPDGSRVEYFANIGREVFGEFRSVQYYLVVRRIYGRRRQAGDKTVLGRLRRLSPKSDANWKGSPSEHGSHPKQAT